MENIPSRLTQLMDLQLLTATSQWAVSLVSGIPRMLLESQEDNLYVELRSPFMELEPHAVFLILKVTTSRR